MNDNDIIKALETCVNHSCYIDGCPFMFDECGADSRIEECLFKMIKCAFGLAKRQRAEIERLNHIRAELSKEIAALREKSEFLERVEAMRIEAEELFWEREEVLAQSDKERQESEAFERLMQIAEMTEGEDGNV